MSKEPVAMAACGVVFDRQTFLWHLRDCKECKKSGKTYWFLNMLGEKILYDKPNNKKEQ